MKKFGMIGAAGFVAPRHMKAVKETGNDLVAAIDPNDSVGVIDSYFPKADFFTEFERFDRHIDLLKRKGKAVDYMSICSPNYLHDAHIRFALRNNIDAICEKPLVLNPWNIDGLVEVEAESEARTHNILQLRLHPALIDLKKKIDAEKNENKYDINLTYITSRGNWYLRSWKGDISKSGGIATNIGIHFFDMLIWIFGGVQENYIHVFEPTKAAGYLELENARVRWFLSVDADSLPEDVKKAGQTTFRSITVDGDEIEFSGGFTDLHTLSYQEILKGNGFTLSKARPSIETVYTIRTSQPSMSGGELHPFIQS